MKDEAKLRDSLLVAVSRSRGVLPLSGVRCATGRAAEEQAVARTQAIGSQHLFATVLAENLPRGRQVVRGQHDILEPSNRLADRQQWETPELTRLCGASHRRVNFSRPRGNLVATRAGHLVRVLPVPCRSLPARFGALPAAIPPRRSRIGNAGHPTAKNR